MAADVTRLLRWYPAAWRQRYGEDLIAYLHDSYGDQRLPARARLSLFTGGLVERVRLSGLGGDSAPPVDRVRAGALVVLCSWAAFVIAGSNFAKLSEHFDQALPTGRAAHHLSDVTYETIQIGAVVAGLAVIVGALLALPGLTRFLRAGGWSAIRWWATLAAGSTVEAVATFIPLRAWAHHLSDTQRNGGSAGYETLFLVWASGSAIALILWTGAAVAAARRTALSRRLLRTEAVLAGVATLAMVAILAATGAWWAALAERAPLFLNSDPSIPANGRLIASVVVMILGAVSAIAGTVRVVRNWPRMVEARSA